MDKLNKLLPENKKNVNPVQQITELYYRGIDDINLRISLAKEAGRDTSLLEMKQSEMLGAITALGKVTQLQHYLDCYDILTVREKKKIIKNTSRV